MSDYECPKCGKAPSEHRIGYSASRCDYQPPANAPRPPRLTNDEWDALEWCEDAFKASAVCHMATVCAALRRLTPPQPSPVNDTPIAWLRDLDGDGLSFHPAIEGDPGAFPVYGEPQPSPVQGDGDARLDAAVRAGIHWQERAEKAEAALAAAQPVVQGDGVSDPLVERACIAAYNECDMGSFPEQAVNPESDRRFVRAALAAAQPGSGFVVVPKVGTRVCTSHPITCLNPEPSFIVSEVKVEHGSFYARGENTCWFGVGMLAAAPKQSQEGG